MASHRLIQYIGKTYGLAVSEAVYDKLNDYYFVQGHALNDRPRLADTVTEELERLLPDGEAPTNQSILKFLNGNEGRKEIEHALDELQQLGIHGIPKFIIEGRTVVDGAAGPNVFVNIFRDIEKRGEIHSGAIFEDILGLRQDVIDAGSHHAEDLVA